MVIGEPLLALPVVRLSSKQQSQEQRCSAVLGANRRLTMQMQSSSAAAPSKALLFSGSTKQVYLLFVCSDSLVQRCDLDF
jgi:hypothetical protein